MIFPRTVNFSHCLSPISFHSISAHSAGGFVATRRLISRHTYAGFLDCGHDPKAQHCYEFMSLDGSPLSEANATARCAPSHPPGGLTRAARSMHGLAGVLPITANSRALGLGHVK
jgi:hypothetical protein